MKLLVLITVLAACVGTQTTSCPESGKLCPSGTVCLQLAADNELCVHPDQFPPCEGVDDGMACTLPGEVAGTCFGGACLVAECGNLRIDAGETCDDGNNRLGDGCSADCLSSEDCGNGRVDPVILSGGTLIANEQCDDGNLVGHDGCSSGCTLETIRWTEIVDADPPGRGNGAMAYDAARNRIVMFGGGIAQPRNSDPTALGDSWAWTDGWSPVSVTLPPQPRHGHGMTYDAKHKQLVLFGGKGTSELSDTWILDGDRWTERSTTLKPPARTRHAMANHPALGVVVFGGEATLGTTLLDDATYAWDGAAWHVIATATRPSTRSDAAMSYDPSRNVIVLHGGTNGTAETWELDGTGWTPVAITGPAIRGASLGFDPIQGGMILFGGIDPFTEESIADTWRWNGQTWTRLAPALRPPPRHGAAMGNDPATGELFLFGGHATIAACMACALLTLEDTWRWTGTTWALLERAAPTTVLGHIAAFDPQRGRMVRYAGTAAPGIAETWEHDGVRWQQPRDLDPPHREDAAMAYDGARRAMVLFGGSLNGVKSNETWTRTGTTWTPTTPAPTAPTARTNHAMAYDPRRQRVVMFGGVADSGWLGDTWEWDGTKWLDVTPMPGTTQPRPRGEVALAYDPSRQRVILFGGMSGAGPFDDMWEWTGSVWERLSPPQAPSPRRGAAMAWDGARGRLVLFGGGFPSGNEAWEWNGTTKTWAFISVASPPPARSGHTVAPAPSGAGVIVYGGRDSTGKELRDMWLLRFASDDAYQTCLGPLDDDGDALSGCADQDCWARCTPACPPSTSCIATEPRCGDGVCNPALESCRLCADCPCEPRCGDWACDPGETIGVCPGDCGP